MGPQRPRAVVLDAGAFIAFEKNDKRVRALIELAVARGALLLTTGAVVAQIWRDGRRQARLARLLGSEVIRVQPLDRAEGQATGAICGEAGTSDIADASVVLLARRHGAVIVTSDIDDLKRLDASAELVRC